MIQSKPSEKGEIITYLSRMGDVLEHITDRGKLTFAACAVHTVIDGNEMNAKLRENNIGIHSHLEIIAPEAAHVFLCQVGTKKILRIYKPFIGGQPPVNGLRFLYALLPFCV